MTTKSSKSASGDDSTPPTPATLASQTEQQDPPADGPESAPEMAVNAVSVPTPGRIVLVQARNPDTNGEIDVPAIVVLAGDPADDGSITTDLWVLDLTGVRRATVQLYGNRDDALASDRPAGYAAWWPPIVNG